MRSVVGILFMVTAFVLALPQSVYAETLPCVVDESGCYVSGTKTGQQDEDLQNKEGDCLVVSQKEGTNSEFTALLLSVLSLLTSRFFVTAVIGVCAVLAVIGIIQLGGCTNHNVRY